MVREFVLTSEIISILSVHFCLQNFTPFIRGTIQQRIWVPLTPYLLYIGRNSVYLVNVMIFFDYLWFYTWHHRKTNYKYYIYETLTIWGWGGVWISNIQYIYLSVQFDMYWIAFAIFSSLSYTCVLDTRRVDTSRPRQNGRQIYRRHIQMNFLEWKCFNLDQNFTEVCT